MGLFCQHPLSTFLFFFFFHLTLPPGHVPPPPPPPPPTPDAAGWTTTLDRRERADKSLHGDSAFCKSCCGRRVFSFPLSLFPPPSTAAKLMLVHNPSLSFSSPLVHSCARSPASYQHFPVNFFFKKNNKIKKTPFPVIDIITLASLFNCLHSITISFYYSFN